MNSRSWIGCSLVVLLSFGSTLAFAKGPERHFNSAAFVGLQQIDASNGNALLDYDLDGPAGEPVHFANCQQVEVSRESDVKPSEIDLWRVLTSNCAAIRQYALSHRARRTHFPQRLTAALVAAFPAEAVPDIGGNFLAGRKGRTLAAHENGLRVSLDTDGSARAEASDETLIYTVMARADFDSDGAEDLLVRAEWSPQDAHGKAVALFVLSRRTPAGRVRITNRH